MPKRLNPYDLNDVARARRIRATVGPPCDDCGEPTIQFSDDTSACSHGGHDLERQVGVRAPKGDTRVEVP